MNVPRVVPVLLLGLSQYAVARGSSASVQNQTDRIAFQSNRCGSLDIFVMDVNGTGLRRITSQEGIAIWVLDIDGGDARKITTSAAWSMMPRWSPDGARIAFAAATDPPFRGGSVEIHVIDVDGRKERRLTNAGAVSEYPSWSRDGRQIVFQGYRDGDFEIFVMNADGSDVRQLTDNEDFDGRPSWGGASGR
jgi:Tol biopolymer transport system component